MLDEHKKCVHDIAAQQNPLERAARFWLQVATWRRFLGCGSTYSFATKNRHSIDSGLTVPAGNRSSGGHPFESMAN